MGAAPLLVWLTGYHRAALLLVGWYSIWVMVALVRSGWLLRLLWRARGFWWIRRGSVVLYYSPDRADAPAVHSVLTCCDAAINELEQQFEFCLRAKVVVILFETAPEVAAVAGQPCGGFAICVANAILINQQQDVGQIVRHELVHLYAARWDTDAPPLLEEGLATWLGTSWGLADVDDQARWLLIKKDGPLKSLLDRSFFFNLKNRDACYTLAASFTGFLIRRYGWDRFRKIYKGARRDGLSYMLRKHVGRKLPEVERLWREELGLPASPCVS
jgi:hypothetical protein